MRTEGISESLLVLRGLIRVPVVVSRFPLLDLAGTSINAVTVNSRACFGNATAFDVVDFAENKLKVRAGRFFRNVADAIQ